MLPNYKSRDFVLTYRRPLEKLINGDVIVVKHDHYGIIIKRILNIDTLKHLTLIGDNSALSTDSENLGLVSFEQVLGKVVFHIATPC